MARQKISVPAVIMAVSAVLIAASCVPIRDEERDISGAGDSPTARAEADRLALPGDSDAASIRTNRIECDKLAGQYSRQGLAGFYMCVLSYSSAGKVCTVKSDCHGQCIATPGENNRATSPGKCQATTVPFGCYATIDNNGRVGGTICRD